MHHHRHAELARELLGRREMIRVSVGVDEIVDPQTVACGQRDVAVDLTELRVDQGGGASLLAADQVGAAAAGGHGFKDHSLLRKRSVQMVRRGLAAIIVDRSYAFAIVIMMGLSRLFLALTTAGSSYNASQRQ